MFFLLWHIWLFTKLDWFCSAQHIKIKFISNIFIERVKFQRKFQIIKFYCKNWHIAAAAPLHVQNLCGYFNSMYTIKPIPTLAVWSKLLDSCIQNVNEVLLNSFFKVTNPNKLKQHKIGNLYWMVKRNIFRLHLTSIGWSNAHFENCSVYSVICLYDNW